MAEGVSRLQRLRWIAEAAAGWLGFGLLRLLPMDAASAAGGWLGRTMGPRLGVQRHARRNLARAFPDLPAAEIERVLRGMWDNLGRVVGEYPHLAGRRVFAEPARFAIEGLEIVDALRDEGRTMIFVSGHVGNWEIAPLVASQYGLPLLAFYRAPDNPLIDRLLRHARRMPGLRHARKGAKGAREGIKALRGGTHLALLIDQKMNDGIPVPFFDRMAMTAPAAAQLAIRHDCPLVPVRVERLRGARFRLVVEPPLEPGRDGMDVAATMTALNHRLEAWIRERPEQWLWAHRRWPD